MVVILAERRRLCIRQRGNSNILKLLRVSLFRSHIHVFIFMHRLPLLLLSPLRLSFDLARVFCTCVCKQRREFQNEHSSPVAKGNNVTGFFWVSELLMISKWEGVASFVITFRTHPFVSSPPVTRSNPFIAVSSLAKCEFDHSFPLEVTYLASCCWYRWWQTYLKQTKFAVGTNCKKKKTFSLFQLERMKIQKSHFVFIMT